MSSLTYSCMGMRHGSELSSQQFVSAVTNVPVPRRWILFNGATGAADSGWRALERSPITRRQDHRAIVACLTSHPAATEHSDCVSGQYHHSFRRGHKQEVQWSCDRFVCGPIKREQRRSVLDALQPESSLRLSVFGVLRLPYRNLIHSYWCYVIPSRRREVGSFSETLLSWVDRQLGRQPDCSILYCWHMSSYEFLLYLTQISRPISSLAGTDIELSPRYSLTPFSRTISSVLMIWYTVCDVMWETNQCDHASERLNDYPALT